MTTRQANPPRTVLLAGATGLVGGELLRLLLEKSECESITALGRSPLGRNAAKLWEVRTDFSDLGALGDALKVDAVFCCLGTTLKKAGSREAFRKVDFEYPTQLAEHARAAGAQQFVLVSSVGANASSSVFYTRVKGEVEAAVQAVPFPGGVKVIRRSFLMGQRVEVRTLERVAQRIGGALSGLLAGPLAVYRPIDAADVATAMWHAACGQPGNHVYEGSSLFALTR